MENKIAIDALPYIDKSSIQKIRKSEIDELINNKMNQIDKSKIEKELNERYHINKKQSKKNKINIIIAPLKDALEVPPMSKYYNEEEWDKLFQELTYTIESKQINNFNLELINLYSSSAWDSCINKSMNHLTQLKNERESLKNDLLFLNKKRKYEQTVYKNELNILDKKIHSTLAQVALIESELMEK